MAAAIGLKGRIISITPVPDFDRLSTEEATKIVYGQIVPACEAKNIKLSLEGNHNSRGCLATIEDYDKMKAEHNLFDIKRIQNAFTFLKTFIEATSKYKFSSYSLKHRVEEAQNLYLSNGDLICAMLLKGFSARFGKRTEAMSVNCEFKARLIIDGK